MVDALSTLIYRGHSYEFGRKMCVKLKELIPRQPVRYCQNSGSNWCKYYFTRTVKAVRKDVTAKCYGGDITRKRKLLEKTGRKVKSGCARLEMFEVPNIILLFKNSINSALYPLIGEQKF